MRINRHRALFQAASFHPSSFILHPSRGRRGFYLIGFLIVLVIIFLLLGQSYFKRDKVTGKTDADAYISRSKVSACSVDRQAMQTDLTAMLASNGGAVPSIHLLRNRFGNKKCPEKGIYEVDAKGNIYCSIHFPPPDGVDVQELADQ